MTRVARLKIMVLGLRGIPRIPGGIEMHAAELYPRLVELGHDVTVIGRTPYRPKDVGSTWRGVRLRWLWSPRRTGLEAGIHTFLGALYAAFRRPHVLHLHAVGPSLAVPLAKLLGLRVVITHHGQDYEREKWSHMARALLHLGEILGVRYTDECIVISSNLQRLLLTKFGRETTYIPNGVSALQPVADSTLLNLHHLRSGEYVIQVSRLVPEKRQLDLIAAFEAARLPGWKLVLVGGGAPRGDPYTAQVREAAAANNNIVLTGAMPPAQVHELLSHAAVFVLPSSHEGLPIALLEAIALDIPALASDIPGNREIGLDDSCYFKVGDTATLTARLEALAGSEQAREAAVRNHAEICARYNWDAIALETFALMERAARPGTMARIRSSRKLETASY